MIFATQRATGLIVGAASTLDALKAFAATHAATLREPDMIEIMSDPLLGRFSDTVWLADFSDAAAAQDFCERNALNLVGPNNLVDRHAEMMKPHQRDEYYPTPEEAEALLQARVAEDLAKIEAEGGDIEAKTDLAHKAFEEARRGGSLNSGSWDATKRAMDGERLARLTELSVRQGIDGKMVVTGATAVKSSKGQTGAGQGGTEAGDGAGTPEKKPAPARSFMAALDALTTPAEAAEMADTDEVAIDPGGIAKTYFKVEISGTKLTDVLAALTAATFAEDRIFKARNHAAGSWLAFVRKLWAEEAEAILTKAGFTVETYGVDDAGQRIIAKDAGATVVDPFAVDKIGPRPWNDQAPAYKALTGEALTKNHKGWKGSEFYFCGSYNGAAEGSTVFIVPKTHFDVHEDFYPESLNLDHMLPSDFKEIAPGCYRTQSRDWRTVLNEVQHRLKMTENLTFALITNGRRFT